MVKVVLSAPLEALPDLIRQAVETIPRATLIEVRPDGALVARKTNFAIASESTRFSFHSRPKGGSEVRAESSSGGALGFVSYPEVVAETGRAVLDALVHLDK
ncbi:hypothetical protein [Frigoribacterium sp. UYMn621]|jgi:hypothetical protein|uniref:hypothetical protein n=1 Tax=Frigoribacterium sp. UYMn621 TaxID=3156343 RepID=UPI0033936D67